MAEIFPLDNQELFYNNLKNKIEDRGYSLKKLAETIGMSVNGIYSAFKNQSLKIGTILKILEVLEIDFQDLFEYNTNKDKKIFLLEKRVEEAEEMIKFLREKNVQFTSDFELNLLDDTRKAIYKAKSVLLGIPKIKIEELEANYPELMTFVNDIMSILSNIITLSSEDEKVKQDYIEMIKDVKKSLAKAKAANAMKIMEGKKELK